MRFALPFRWRPGNPLSMDCCSIPIYHTLTGATEKENNNNKSETVELFRKWAKLKSCGTLLLLFMLLLHVSIHPSIYYCWPLSLPFPMSTTNGAAKFATSSKCYELLLLLPTTQRPCVSGCSCWLLEHFYPSTRLHSLPLFNWQTVRNYFFYCPIDVISIMTELPVPEFFVNQPCLIRSLL